MAAGDLSPDQARYVDIVASATGLARLVVVAWVGAESGWGINKAGHNYLNVGPGETYPTVEQAAARAAGLVNTSDHYIGIRAAIPAGAGAQIEAIGASPWGTSASLLSTVYAQLSGATAAPTATDVSIHIPGTPWDVPTPGDAAGAVTGAIGDAVKAGVGLFIEGALGLVFTAAALAIIAVAVNRLTGGSVKKTFDTVSGVAQSAGTAAAMA